MNNQTTDLKTKLPNYKTIYYFVNPRYFKDSNNDGIGDLLGLAKQTHYFQLLNINSIILTDIFSEDTNTLPFSTINSSVGNNQQFETMIKHFHKHGLKVIVELPLSILGHNYLWLKNATKLATQGLTRERYLYEASTQEITLNSDQTLLSNLIDTMNHWSSKGVDGFVLKDFETLGNTIKDEMLASRTINLLKQIYLRTRNLNKKITIIGFSDQLSYKAMLNLTHGNHKIFDQVISSQIAHLNSRQQTLHTLPGFKSKTLVQLLKRVINHPQINLSFSLPNQGRLISRWGSDLGYWKESAKCLALLFYLNKNHNHLFFGDEIGLPNLQFQNKAQLNDEITQIQTREKQSQGIKLKQINKHHHLHHHKHTKQTMPWNSQLNGGFSLSENHYYLNHHYTEINVSNQLLDQTSILDFHRKLIALTSSRFFQKICQYGVLKIKSQANGLIVIKGKNHFDQFKAYINLSLHNKNITWLKPKNQFQVVLSSYSHAKYKKPILKLKAYEGIILLKTSKDYLAT